jgi:transcriptional regulator with XRE-family HTH domain
MRVALAEPRCGDQLLERRFLGHSSCSHITDTISSQKVRRSLNAPVRELSYHPDMDDKVPHYLKEWRKFRGMTQQELADRLDTSKSVISDMERGELQLSPKWLRRIAPVLQTQPGHILDHDPATIDNDIIDIWAHIEVRDREQAIRVLRSFVKTGTNN